MFILFLLFVTLPIAELYILFEVGDEIGGMNTFLLVLLTGVIGAYFAKMEGREILKSIQSEMAAGKMPQDQMIHGFLVLVGGVLLMTPGFVTDAFGLFLVFPLTRYLFLSFFKNALVTRVGKGSVQFHYYQGGGTRTDCSEYSTSAASQDRVSSASHQVIDVEVERD